VSEDAFRHVSEFFTGDEIIEHSRKFYKITGITMGIRTRVD